MPDGLYRSDAEHRAARAEILRNDLHELKDELRRNPEKVVTALLREEPTFRGARNVRYYPRGGLSVSLDTGLWHDKRSNQGGSLFDFVVAQTGSLPAAIDWSRAHLNRPAPDLARPLSAADRRQYQERQAAALVEAAAAQIRREQEIATKQREVAVKCRAEWERSKPAPAEHPYIVAKQLPPDGLRIDRHGNLLAPMQTAAGELVGLQRIAADGGEKWRKLGFPVQGNKMFPAGVLKDGTFMVIGDASDPTRPVAFAEGWATGKSFNVCTGLPVVVCWDVGNKETVMTNWWQQHPDRILLDAADNDLSAGKNAGAAMAQQLQRTVGSIPLLPQFTDPAEGSDWNDRHRSKGTADTGAEIGAALLSELRKIANPKEVTVSDGLSLDAASAPATSQAPPKVEPTPRQRLIAILVADGEKVMGFSPVRALKLAQSAVNQLSDEQVLQHLPVPTGQPATVASVVTPPITLTPTTQTAAHPSTEESPMRETLRKLKEQVEQAQDLPAKFTKVIDLLGGRLDQHPEMANNPEIRTQVAYMVQDIERTGLQFVLPPDLRSEMNRLATAAPGLTNRGMVDLMQITSTVTDQALVQKIRDGADLLRNMGAAQETPAAQDRVTALQLAVAAQMQGQQAATTTAPSATASENYGPPIPADLAQTLAAAAGATTAPGSTPAETVPPAPTAASEIYGPPIPPDLAQALAAAAEATTAPSSKPPEAAPPSQAAASTTTPPEAPSVAHATPSPGPGQQIPPAAGVQGQVASAAAAPAAAAAVAGRATEANPGGTLFSKFLRTPGERSGPAPWETASTGLAERLSHFGTVLADSKTEQLMSTAEQGARAAMEAVRRFSSGPARELYTKIETAAASEPGGVQAVMSEMRAGGRHEALRSEFTNLMSKPEFASAYQNTTAAIGTYATAREKFAMDLASRGLDNSKSAGFDRTDAVIGEEASKMPGIEAGKSHLEEMAHRLAEFFRTAIEKVASAVNSVRASVGTSSSPSPSPSP